MDWHDAPLSMAGVIGSVAIVHGVLTQRLMIRPFEQLESEQVSAPIRRLVPLLLQFSTFNWLRLEESPRRTSPSSILSTCVQPTGRAAAARLVEWPLPYAAGLPAGRSRRANPLTRAEPIPSPDVLTASPRDEPVNREPLGGRLEW
jgi:hypothetical protein